MVEQEGLNEATILSLVSTGLGVGWVLESARWRCPETVAILPVVELNVPVRLALEWRRDNTSALLARFVDEVRHLPEVQAVNGRSTDGHPFAGGGWRRVNYDAVGEPAQAAVAERERSAAAEAATR